MIRPCILREGCCVSRVNSDDTAVHFEGGVLCKQD